jgi:uncharacterized protein YeaO (DUF488 family)
MVIRLKRVYDPPSGEDGFRVLVERLWPRGISKERARVDLWVKEAGASTELRKWFGHDPDKWEEFHRKYFDEISQRPEVLRVMRDILRAHHVVTFLFAAHDEEHNNAVALKEFFEQNRSEDSS